MTLSKDSTKLINYPTAQPKALKTRVVNADWHNHFRLGYDMAGLLPKILKKARKRLGPRGIVGAIDFENRGDQSRYTQLLRQARDKVDFTCAFYEPSSEILIVRGQEVPTKQGHLLVLGLNDGVHLASGRELESTLKEAKSHGGIIIADHPFYLEGIGQTLAKGFGYSKEHKQGQCEDSNLLSYFDALAWNSSASLWLPGITPKYANEEALRFYRYMRGYYPNLGLIADSDGHSIFEMGRSYTAIQMPNYLNLDSRELKQNLRRAVRESTQENCTMTPAIVGPLKHGLEIKAIECLRKIGFKI